MARASTRTWQGLAAGVLLVFVGASCSAAGAVECLEEELALDGGDPCRGDGEFSGDGDLGALDAGPDPSAFVDGSPPDACAALLTKVCGGGAGPSCAEEASCVAADLLARYEPARCEEALGNGQGFPPCVASVCQVLVAKVCGQADDACSMRAPCGAAVDLLARSTDAATDADRRAAEGACEAALQDDTVFAPCAP